MLPIQKVFVFIMTAYLITVVILVKSGRNQIQKANLIIDEIDFQSVFQILDDWKRPFINTIKPIKDGGKCEDLDGDYVNLLRYVWPGLREDCSQISKKCKQRHAFPMVQWKHMLGLNYCGRIQSLPKGHETGFLYLEHVDKNGNCSTAEHVKCNLMGKSGKTGANYTCNLFGDPVEVQEGEGDNSFMDRQIPGYSNMARNCPGVHFRI